LSISFYSIGSGKTHGFFLSHLNINWTPKSKPKEINLGPQTLNSQINGGNTNINATLS